ncbi:protein TOPAZ1 isoform X2 [Ambystoma mexicanum]|uniref:protein TOPAZ1 isoform X2 n=1 Tax=Ambystoma mexicanum TaxID=8296 RepID=UPI0037E83146
MIELRSRKGALKKIQIAGGRGSAKDKGHKCFANGVTPEGNDIVDGSELPKLQPEKLKEQNVVAGAKRIKGRRKRLSTSPVQKPGCSKSAESNRLVVTRSALRGSLVKVRKSKPLCGKSFRASSVKKTSSGIRTRKGRSSVEQTLNVHPSEHSEGIDILVVPSTSSKNKAVKRKMGRTRAECTLKGIEVNSRVDVKNKHTAGSLTEQVLTNGLKAHAGCIDLVVTPNNSEAKTIKQRIVRAGSKPIVNEAEVQYLASEENCRSFSVKRTLKACPVKSLVSNKLPKRRLKPQFQTSVCCVTVESASELVNHGCKSSSDQNLTPGLGKLAQNSQLGMTVPVSVGNKDVKRRRVEHRLKHFQSSGLENGSKEGNHFTTNSSAGQTFEPTESRTFKKSSICLKIGTRKKTCIEPSVQKISEIESNEGLSCTRHLSSEQLSNANTSELKGCHVSDGAQSCLKNKAVKKRGTLHFQPNCQSTMLDTLTTQNDHCTASSSTSQTLHAVFSESARCRVFKGTCPTRARNDIREGRKKDFIQTSIQDASEKGPDEGNRDSMLSIDEETLIANSSETKGSDGAVMAQSSCLKEKVVKRRGRPRRQQDLQSSGLGKMPDNGNFSTTSSSSEQQLNEDPSELKGSNGCLLAKSTCVKDKALKRRGRRQDLQFSALDGMPDDAHRSTQLSSAKQLFNEDPSEPNGYDGSQVAESTCLNNKPLKRRGRPRLRQVPQISVLENWSNGGNYSNPFTSAKQLLNEDSTEPKECEGSGLSQSTCLKVKTLKRRGRPRRRQDLQSSELVNLTDNGRLCTQSSYTKPILKAEPKESNSTPCPSLQSTSLQDKVVKRRGRPCLLKQDSQSIGVDMPNKGNRCARSSSADAIHADMSIPTDCSIVGGKVPFRLNGDAIERKRSARLESSNLMDKLQERVHCAKSSVAEHVSNVDFNEPKPVSQLAQSTCFKDKGVKRRGRPRILPNVPFSGLDNTCSSSSSAVQKFGVVPLDSKGSPGLGGKVTIRPKDNTCTRRKGASLESSEQQQLAFGLDVGTSFLRKVKNSEQSESENESAVATSTFSKDKDVKRRGRPRLQPNLETKPLNKSVEASHPSRSSSVEQALPVIHDKPTVNGELAATVTIWRKGKDIGKREGAHTTSNTQGLLGDGPEGTPCIRRCFSEPLLNTYPCDPKGFDEFIAMQATTRQRCPALHPPFQSSILANESIQGSHSSTHISGEHALGAVSIEPNESGVLVETMSICLKVDGGKSGKMPHHECSMQGVLDKTSGEVNHCPSHYSDEQLLSAESSELKGSNKSLVAQSTCLKNTAVMRRGWAQVKPTLKGVAVVDAYSAENTSADHELNCNIKETGNKVALARTNTPLKRKLELDHIQSNSQRIEVGSVSCAAQPNETLGGQTPLGINTFTSLKSKPDRLKRGSTPSEADLQRVELDNVLAKRAPCTRSSSTDSILACATSECKQSAVQVAISFGGKVVERKWPLQFDPHLQQSWSYKNKLNTRRSSSEPPISSRSFEESKVVQRNVKLESRVGMYGKLEKNDVAVQVERKKRGRQLGKKRKETNTFESRGAEIVDRGVYFFPKKIKTLHVRVWKRKGMPRDSSNAIKCKQTDDKLNEEVSSIPDTPTNGRLGAEGKTDGRNKATSLCRLASNRRLLGRRQTYPVEDSNTNVTQEDNPEVTYLKSLSDCNFKQQTADAFSFKRPSPSAQTRTLRNVANARTIVASTTSSTNTRCSKPSELREEEHKVPDDLLECNNGQNMDISKCPHSGQISENEKSSPEPLKEDSSQSVNSAKDVNSNVGNNYADVMQGAEMFNRQSKWGDITNTSSESSDMNSNSVTNVMAEASKWCVVSNKEINYSNVGLGIPSCSLKQQNLLLEKSRTTAKKRKKAPKKRIDPAETSLKVTALEDGQQERTELKYRKKFAGKTHETVFASQNCELESLGGLLDKNTLMADSLLLNDHSDNWSAQQTKSFPNKELSKCDIVVDLLEEAISLLRVKDGDDTECKNGELDVHFNYFDFPDGILNHQDTASHADQIENSASCIGTMFEEVIRFSCQRVVPMVGKHAWKCIPLSRTCAWPFSENVLSSLKANRIISYEACSCEESIGELSEFPVKEIEVDVIKVVAEGDHEFACKKRRRLDPCSGIQNSNTSPVHEAIKGDMDDHLISSISECAHKTVIALHSSRDTHRFKIDGTYNSGNDTFQSTEQCTERTVGRTNSEDCAVSSVTAVEMQNHGCYLDTGNLTRGSKMASNAKGANQEIVGPPDYATLRDKDDSTNSNTSSYLECDQADTNVFVSLKLNNVESTCHNSPSARGSPHFSDERRVPAEVSSENDALGKSDLFASDNPAVTLGESCKPDYLNDGALLLEYNVPNENVMTCDPNENDPISASPVVQDVILLDVIQDDPDLFEGSTDLRSIKPVIKSAKVQKDFPEGDLDSLCTFSDQELSSKSHTRYANPASNLIAEHLKIVTPLDSAILRDKDYSKGSNNSSYSEFGHTKKSVPVFFENSVHSSCHSTPSPSSPHFPDEPAEEIVSCECPLLGKGELFSFGRIAVSLDESHTPGSLSDELKANVPSENVKACAPNENVRTNASPVFEDVLLLDVIQDDPDLFEGANEEELKSAMQVSNVHKEIINDTCKGSQNLKHSWYTFSDQEFSSRGNSSAGSPIREYEESLNYDIECSSFGTDSKTNTPMALSASSSVAEIAEEALEFDIRTETFRKKFHLPVPDEVKEENVIGGKSDYTQFTDSNSVQHEHYKIRPHSEIESNKECTRLPTWHDEFGYKGKSSATSRAWLPPPPAPDMRESWKPEKAGQAWQPMAKTVLPAGYCQFYFNTVRGCLRTPCWFTHIPKEEDEKLCMEIVQKLLNVSDPKVLHRAVQVFTNYYREVLPGVHYDSNVLDELLIALLKQFMLPDVFHTLNIGVNVKILMVEAGMVLQLEHLDYIEKHVTQMEASESEINIIVSTKSRLQARQFKKNWICDLNVAVAEIEHCKEQSNWIKLGNLYVNIRMAFENLPDLKKLSNCITEALLKDSKEEKIVPFCIFADTVKKDPLHNGVDKNLLGRIGITVMFSYHKTEQWLKGKKVIDKLRDMHIHFTVMKGLIGEESKATRCQVVNIAAEILYKSGSLDGAFWVLKVSEWVISTPLWPCETMDVLTRHNLLCLLAHQSLEKSLYQQTFEILQHLPGLQDATDALDVSQYSIIFNRLLESCVDNNSIGLSSAVAEFMALKTIPINSSILRALITASGRSSLWLKARVHYKCALIKGCYPPMEGNLYRKMLLIASFMSEIEMILAIEYFMVSNAGSIQSPSGANQTLEIVLKRCMENQAASKERYQAAMKRVLQCVRLFEPKLFLKHLTVNITMEQVYLLEHRTALRWLNENMKWAGKVWLF